MARPVLLVLTLLLGVGVSRAEVFTVSGELDGGNGGYGMLSGTESIDTVAGTLTGANISMTLPDGVFHFSLADLDIAGLYLDTYCTMPGNNPEGNGCAVYFQSFQTADAYADLSFDVNATLGLVGYAGSGFCGTETANCDLNGEDHNDTTDGPSDFYYVGTGGLAPAATTVTPEPTGLLLLGTGALGGVGVLRRWSAKRA